MLSASSLQLQWSFRKTGTLGTLASRVEIGVWIQTPGGALLVVDTGGGRPPPAVEVRGIIP